MKYATNTIIHQVHPEDVEKLNTSVDEPTEDGSYMIWFRKRFESEFVNEACGHLVGVIIGRDELEALSQQIQKVL